VNRRHKLPTYLLPRSPHGAKTTLTCQSNVTIGSYATCQSHKPLFCLRYVCYLLIVWSLPRNSPMSEHFWYVHLLRQRHVLVTACCHRPRPWKLRYRRNVEPCCLGEFSYAVCACYSHRLDPVFTLWRDFLRPFCLTHPTTHPNVANLWNRRSVSITSNWHNDNVITSKTAIHHVNLAKSVVPEGII